MKDITLHPTEGVNPRITCCVKCGEEIGIALLGIKDQVITCADCGTQNIGASYGEKCGVCKERLSQFKDKKRKIEQNEKIPGGLCDSCREEKERHEELVRLGGIFWRCQSCNSCGVIKRSAYSLEIKKNLGFKENGLCGVIFDESDCPIGCEDRQQ